MWEVFFGVIASFVIGWIMMFVFKTVGLVIEGIPQAVQFIILVVVLFVMLYPTFRKKN